jgi:hypothetical protein
MMPSEIFPMFVVTLTEHDGRAVGRLAYRGGVVPKYIFVDETTSDIDISDDPDDRPMGYTRYDRIGSAVWLDEVGSERAAIFERAIA